MDEREFIAAAYPYFGKSVYDIVSDDVFWDQLCEIYSSQAIDRECGQVDRHKKFAEWVYRHAIMVLKMGKFEAMEQADAKLPKVNVFSKEEVILN